jgi:hypothetical protein
MKRIKEIPYKILIGFLDAILPNTKESIQLKESEFLREKPTYEIDYIRLLSSLIGFLTILMGLCKMIDLEYVIAILNGN